MPSKLSDRKRKLRRASRLAGRSVLPTHVGQAVIAGSISLLPISYVRPFCYLRQNFLTAAPLLLIDAMAIATAVFASAADVGLTALTVRSGLVIPTVVFLLLALAAVGLYPGVGLNRLEEFRRLAVATVGGYLLLFFTMSAAQATVDVLTVAIAAPTTLLLLLLFRTLCRSACAPLHWWTQPTLIVGSGSVAAQVLLHLRANPELGLSPVGWVANSTATSLVAAPRETYLGSIQSLPRLLLQHDIYRVIVAESAEHTAGMTRLLEQYARMVPHLYIVPDAAMMGGLWKPSNYLGSLGLAVHLRILSPGHVFAKRAIDLTLITLASIVIVPLVVCLSLAVFLSSPGPIFYSHKRIARDKKSFAAWKFRTMVTDADAVLVQHLAAYPDLRDEWGRTQKLKKDPRVTKIGYFLRKTSLDELPQLWNVLIGDMSLVGPRPIVAAEIEKYGEVFGLYATVKPGITGLWQVSGRNNTTYEERVRLDCYYVRNWSLGLDLFILMRTLPVVLRGEGAY